MINVLQISALYPYDRSQRGLRGINQGKPNQNEGFFCLDSGLGGIWECQNRASGGQHSRNRGSWVERGGVRTSQPETICITCAQSTGQSPVLNLMPDGTRCRACADRVLDAQPGIFHAVWSEPAPQLPAPEFTLVKSVKSSKPSA